jgi:7-keto-8-aminopelargonate synthetase-like enzyme
VSRVLPMHPSALHRFRLQVADIHMDLESDIADFLDTEALIPYSQRFSTVSLPLQCVAISLLLTRYP